MRVPSVRFGLKWALAAVVGPLLLIASPAQASVPPASPSNGTLYGITRCFDATQCNSSSLIKIDPATGAQTQVASLGDLYASQLTADPNSTLLYAMKLVFGGGRGCGCSPDQVMTIDSRSGLVSVSPILAAPLAALAVDPISHSLYGLTTTSRIVRVNPTTGVFTDLAVMSTGRSEPIDLALDPASQKLYATYADFTLLPATGQLFAVSAGTGALAPAVNLNPTVFDLVFDTSAGALFGLSMQFGGIATPIRLVRLDATSGSQTAVGAGSFVFNILPTGAAIDSRSHTYYAVDSHLEGSGEVSRVITVNDQTGVGSVSPAMAHTVFQIAFQPAAITAETLMAEVRDALNAGTIDNGGIAQSLLAKLMAAASASSRHQCATAAHVYGAFVNEVTAQAGQHIAASVAAGLASDAQTLSASCIN